MFTGSLNFLSFDCFNLVSKAVILIQFSILCLFPSKKIIEACVVIYNWKKKASQCIFSRFWMLHLQLCSRALCSLISRAPEGLWEQGRCDPSWQMVHTLLCRESLKEEGSQSHSAHQSQPQASHLWFRGFPQGVPEKAWGWQLQGHLLYPSPSSKAWWFYHLSYGGVLAASWGFLLRPLLLS